MKSYPSTMARLARWQSSSIASASPRPPALGSKWIGSVIERKPRAFEPSSWRSLASCWLSRIGVLSLIWRADSGPGSSRFPSAPIVVSADMISFSRIASTGGLVTWAKSCLK